MKMAFWKRALVIIGLCAFAIAVAPEKGTRPRTPKVQAVGGQSIGNPFPDLVWTGKVKSVSVLDGKKVAEVEMESDSGPITLWLGVGESDFADGERCLVKWVERPSGVAGPRRVLAAFKGEK